MASEAPSTPSKRQAWFCTTGLPSDVVIEVDHMTFHLHKFPLMSKSKKLNDLITQQEKEQLSLNKLNYQNDDDVESDEEELEEQEQCHVSLANFPGGVETFETAAKFCYGVKIELTAGKVTSLRCAGEVLEMTEEYSENNLISKTEKFLTLNVFANIRDSIKALKSCENLYPLAENLGIVERCIHTISSKASLYDPTSFGWPVNETPSAVAGGATAAKSRNPWIEDLAKLSSPMFNRVISSMRENEINEDIIETCLMHYANRCFPGINRANRNPPVSSSSSSMIPSEKEQRELLENIIANLSPVRSSRSPATARFLFGLLRTANILGVSVARKSDLESKIGAQLDKATLDDLLIPSYSYLNETLYDVDCVERILDYFLECYEEGEIEGGNVRGLTAVMVVGRLIDGYLSEIASDSNLKPEKFCELAMSLPEQARLYNDGVYRAVDVYLKAHPWISEEDREKVSGVINCEKLTLEACTHAAQNERLPLRVVVQVLFFEQLQLRQAIAGTLLSAEAGAADDSPQPSINRQSNDDVEGEDRRVATWRATKRENQVLRLDMDSMRTRVHELERECSSMKKVIEKIDSVGTPQNEGNKGWKKGSFGRKFGCRFKTQVCDSHESSVVETRKGRHHSKNTHQH
ncbi:hypothetical protein RND81_02G167800 [Saponaria officinalis]|uniref:Phototropic-responsive NPH3 family protein n=1 Tax=Saponaria officinalis TaxID=3572 RepID=A0AAW1MV82_SAPOF